MVAAGIGFRWPHDVKAFHSCARCSEMKSRNIEALHNNDRVAAGRLLLIEQRLPTALVNCHGFKPGRRRVVTSHNG